VWRISTVVLSLNHHENIFLLLLKGFYRRYCSTDLFYHYSKWCCYCSIALLGHYSKRCCNCFIALLGHYSKRFCHCSVVLSLNLHGNIFLLLLKGFYRRCCSFDSFYHYSKWCCHCSFVLLLCWVIILNDVAIVLSVTVSLIHVAVMTVLLPPWSKGTLDFCDSFHRS